jgi:hypothetical protein
MLRPVVEDIGPDLILTPVPKRLQKPAAVTTERKQLNLTKILKQKLTGLSEHFRMLYLNCGKIRE